MQLFAIIARVEHREDRIFFSEGQDIVKHFLKKQLNQEQVEVYLVLFNEFLSAHHKTSKHKDDSRKRTSLNSVKVLRICTQINEELTQHQKIIVLLRLFEFINAGGKVTQQENEFVASVAETFHISHEEFRRIRRFVLKTDEAMADSGFLLSINSKRHNRYKKARHIYSEGISNEIRVLRIVSVSIYLLRYLGTKELFLNGQLITNDRNYILTNGSSIRSAKIQPVYYSDIIAAFRSDTAATKVTFKANHIQYRFKDGKMGLHRLSFAEESGKLIGIMGGSGAGKSTLLNILNGNYMPSEGVVTINGTDIHKDANSIKGVIGYIAQDDLLIEELTVFQNLYYNARLCFSQLNNKRLEERVWRMLDSLGLRGIGNLKVGNPMNKTISGGQRKRLNIALELIREPLVLFVDEPTSGLSSRDSENIMDLMKELTLKGKLLFVVIHQPSSDIFKMFDKLLILDQGGYPIYYGNPVEAVVYFKKQVNHVNANESECITCGNVNPEKIFNIIESRVVDEFGNLTQNRKVSPKQWNTAYTSILEPKTETVEEGVETPERTFHPPGLLKQFRVFITRDILSKLTNRQYVVVNILEAPILAAILAFFVKFYPADASNEAVGYVFRENENIPQYLFMSVVVALFIGLSVSAQEIIRDQRILKRERFLNLSRGSYLFSKISVMFAISAVQSFLFVLVGNLLLKIDGMLWQFWIILFSTSCFANMLGLNISASFNSAKVIYILIPFLLIPQLLFSGVIVKFDKLIPSIASQSSVPFIGNIMASRWAYEAMAVTQFKTNAYEKQFFDYDVLLKSYNFKKDIWIKRLEKRSMNLRKQLKGTGNQTKHFNRKIKLLYNEMNKVRFELDELTRLKKLDPSLVQMDLKYTESLTADHLDLRVLDRLDRDLKSLFNLYKKEYNRLDKERDQWVVSLTGDTAGNARFLELKNRYQNESLLNFVTNRNVLSDVSVEVNGELIQKSYPIYRLPFHKGWFGAHFYAPVKRIFGMYIDTFPANIMVLWLMCIALTATLYFDMLRKTIEGLERLLSLLPFGKANPH